VTLRGLLLVSLLAARCGPRTEDSAGASTEQPLGVGLRHFEGEATVGKGYAGWEAFHFTGEQGLGEDLCQIRYAMNSTAVRSDCPDCTWAFDLGTSDARVEAETDKGCAELGVDPGDFEGLSYSYGWAGSSGPYESVLMYQVGSYGWYPVAPARWEEPGFSYDWEMGLYYY
jgi:hypothetical protein